VSDASLDAMTDFGTGEAYPGYGLGVFDLTDRSGALPVPAIGNGGQDSAGYASVMVTLPSEGTVIVVLINQDVDPQLRAIPVVRALADALSR
jgi:CubicO group peptidase (beta-lactamase class C family)